MANYFFETITAPQALAITTADQLIFTTAGATAAAATVTINAATATAPQSVSISFNGRTVVFGDGILNNQNVVFPDSSELYVGDSAANAVAAGEQGDAPFFQLADVEHLDDEVR